jgi:hypothetical protein
LQEVDDDFENDDICPNPFKDHVDHEEEEFYLQNFDDYDEDPKEENKY